jgi:hypothetical protein
MPEIILVPPANSPDVRKLRELDIHRLILGRAERSGNTFHTRRRCRLKTSVH